MVKILCFGNSLTDGFWHYGLEPPHPYAIALKEHLVQQKVLDEKDIQIKVEGKPGDLVNCPPGRFVERMKQSLQEGQEYDWVIVLGGTNDLGYGSFTPEQIYAGLKTTWSLALSSSPTTKLLALTVPECAYISNKLTRNRDVLNKHIMEHKEDRFFAFDLKSVIPYHSMDAERRQEIWDDGLHFTDKGYDLMGHLIAERLIELLKETL
ncbi:SGNH hydrolase-type esterase domain-containing protein [Talaromyces proteolyticus]|uniref:SGNH hydrolase-type esterase domain-containing protein n=1 Tax=Talaromyces proteolyticus TaxID=1131652 RepID=A0AAD4PUT1_9EURO|nr:SGNH hydrolase-type esterase domain-containing protein [Talaromyces proteolyticus]KAH8690504.1 SGNH hydrolase-type esterase domain-containing protein [Talaromyces proteolyticus]